MPLDQLVEQARLKQETQKCKRSAQGKHESKLQQEQAVYTSARQLRWLLPNEQ